MSRVEHVCITCGKLRVIQGRGQCARCYQTDPQMVHRCAEKLAEQIDPAPDWFTGFGVFLAQRLAPTHAVSLLHQTADLLATSHIPTAVLQAARRPGFAIGSLARTLEAYFIAARLTLPLDTAEQAAAIRRARRVADVPAAFRSLVADFDTDQLHSRERARRAGTKPRSDRTLEINLAAVRDLARFLAAHRQTSQRGRWSASPTSKPSCPPSTMLAIGRGSCTHCRCSSASPAAAGTSWPTPPATSQPAQRRLLRRRLQTQPVQAIRAQSRGPIPRSR